MTPPSVSNPKERGQTSSKTILPTSPERTPACHQEMCSDLEFEHGWIQSAQSSQYIQESEMITLKFINWNTLGPRKLGHLHFYVILLKPIVINLLCISKRKSNRIQYVQ